mmetsp:Transcript_67533/g.213780  ORF Transcript_67533/g.213780 Transcript_67533/m.213780 type:complete len:209 (+) Transcript_67533:2822-3448(+)
MVLRQHGVVGVDVTVGHLHQVGAVRHPAPLAGVPRGVGVAASPLHVHIVALVRHQRLGREVILHAGVHLDDIAPPPAHVKVPDLGAPELAGAAEHLEGVGAVLEHPPDLLRVYGEAERPRLVEPEAEEVLGWVLQHRAPLLIQARVRHAGAPRHVVPGGYVVADAQHARGLVPPLGQDVAGDRPVVAQRDAVGAVAVMVVAHVAYGLA